MTQVREIDAGSRSGHFVVAAGAYFVLFGAVFSRIVLSGRLLATGDGLLHALPAFHAPLTLWSPAIFSGYPVAADPQNMFWYPLAMVLPNGLAWFSLLIVLGYTVAAWAQYVFVWTLTRSKKAAAVAGLVYGFSGFFAAHIGHVNMIQSAAWAPLFLTGVEMAYRSRRVHGVVVAAFGLAMCTLGGHPQIVVLTMILGGAFAAFRAVGAAGGWKVFLARCAGAVILGLGMASILLVPLVQLAHFSMRRAIPYDFFVQGSFPPWQLVTLVFPAAAGGWRTPFNHVPYFGDWYVSDVTGFLGLTAVFLAIVALLAWRPRSLGRFWVAIAGGSVILALGRSTPLAHVLYLVPVVNKFRSPSRFLFGLTLAVSVLAGLGLAGLEHLPAHQRLNIMRRAMGWMAALIGAAVGTMVATSGTFRAHAMVKLHLAPPGRIPWTAATFLVPLVFFSLSLVALRWWSDRPDSRLRSVLMVTMVTLELVHFGWIYPRKAFVATAWFPKVQRRLASLMDVLNGSASRYLPFEGKNQDAKDGVPNLSLLWGWPCASGYNPLILRRYALFLSMKRWGAVSSDVVRPSNRILDLLAVRFLLVPGRRRSLLADLLEPHHHPARADHTVGRPPSPRWTVWGSLGSTTVVENRNRLPRAWIVHRVIQLPDGAVRRAVSTSRLPGGAVFAPERTALIPSGAGHHSLQPSVHTSIQLTRLGAGHTVLHVDGTGPAFLVFSGVEYPGWSARIDGHRVPVVRTDGLLRGVWIPGGSHDVRFDFRPLTFRIGASLSLGSWLLLLWLVWWDRQRHAMKGGV